MPQHPGLSRQGLVYVGIVIAAGLLAIAASLLELRAGRIDPRWLILAVLTVGSASLAIKIPGIPARISVSESFVFTAVLVFGVAAGAMTVALDGLVASLWIHRRKPYAAYKTLFNLSAPTLALWISATASFGFEGIRPVTEHATPVQDLIAPLFVFAAVYFALNSGLTAIAISFETRVSPVKVWGDNFLWLAINYFGGASVSLLLLLLFDTAVWRSAALAITVPLVTVFYLTLRTVMGRAEDTFNHLTELERAGKERAKLEDQLRDAHRLESVGRLAAGVAHDLNNLLAPILGYADILLDEIPEAGPHREELQQIKHAAERARDLTRQLLAFGRKQLLSMALLDLRNVVAGFQGLLQRTLREDIRLDVRLPGSLGAVRADAAQIEQVMMNLAVNAQDAMPEGGVLTMELADTAVDQVMAARQPGLTPGPYVTLVMTDTGHGMDQDTLRLVCEPFFTTKDRGKGTGLGLSTVYGIVKQHGGHLQIESTEGKGSSFTIYLHRIEGPQDLRVPASVPSPPAERGSEHVLVVEDNDAVRTMTCQILERLGYRVTSAAGGQAGLDLVRAGGDPIGLLLTDVVLPDMSGRDVFERLSALQPGLRVLYMSGYAGEVISTHGVLEEGVQFIQKPFAPQSLARKLRQVIDAPR
jgi:signal transduction histidine kinase/CheY-like chemotaxis protein